MDDLQGHLLSLIRGASVSSQMISKIMVVLHFQIFTIGQTHVQFNFSEEYASNMKALLDKDEEEISLCAEDSELFFNLFASVDLVPMSNWFRYSEYAIFLALEVYNAKNTFETYTNDHEVAMHKWRQAMTVVFRDAVFEVKRPGYVNTFRFSINRLAWLHDTYDGYDRFICPKTLISSEYAISCEDYNCIQTDLKAAGAIFGMTFVVRMTNE